MELNKKAFGLTSGILWGAMVFFVTIFLLLRGSEGNFIIRLKAVYIGYTFSYLGSLIGLVWAFVTGFIVGWLFAFFYNMFGKKS